MNALELFRLDGKTAVITGAGSGLGYAIAEAMAEAGADVVCGDINQALNEATAARVSALGRRSLAIHCDVTCESDVVNLFQQARDQLGTVDIAFANAGIADPTPVPLHETTTENWNRVLDINLQGVYYTCREALKYMVPRGEGKLINIASMWGLRGSPFMPIPSYTASKGAVINLTRELALEYAQHNIQVNAICPGFFRTRLGDGGYENPNFVAMAAQATPMGRIAEADEIKGTALYLASKASSFTTGAVLVSDGGCLAR